MEIETKRATIDTMSVTISALHVDAKQMTLALFRQLPQARVYAPDGSLITRQYWGVVRYAIRDQGTLWAVAVQDEILYRCAADNPHNLVDRQISVCQRVAGELADAEERMEAWKRYQAWKRTQSGPMPPYVPLPPDVQMLRDRVAGATRELQRCRAAAETMSYLQKLPQLFIAV